MSSCSLHICSCSSLITFRTDCRKEEKGEKALRVNQLSDTEFPKGASQKEGRMEGRVKGVSSRGHPAGTVCDPHSLYGEPKDVALFLRPAPSLGQPWGLNKHLVAPCAIRGGG